MFFANFIICVSFLGANPQTPVLIPMKDKQRRSAARQKSHTLKSDPYFKDTQHMFGVFVNMFDLYLPIVCEHANTDLWTIIKLL